MGDWTARSFFFLFESERWHSISQFTKVVSFLPKTSNRIQLCLKTSMILLGNSGYLRPYKRLAALLDGMKKDIQDYVAHCDTCQRHKYQALSSAGLLQPLPIPTQVWEDISLEFIIGLPRSQRYDTILILVDRLTKDAHFSCLYHILSLLKIDFTKEIIGLLPKLNIEYRYRILLVCFGKNCSSSTAPLCSSGSPGDRGC